MDHWPFLIFRSVSVSSSVSYSFLYAGGTVMTPEEQEQAFLAAVEEQLDQRPNPPEGASPRQVEDWFLSIINAIRPNLVPRMMPLAIFTLWKRTLRRTYQFQASWGEAKQKTDIILRQELLERIANSAESSE
jgi:hypothetical protein